MTPNIEISPDLFKRIQKHAVPLVDTVETTIARAFDSLEATGTTIPPVGDDIRVFSPFDAPSLTFATLTSATFDGEAVSKPNWNLLMDVVIRKTFKRFKNLDDFIDACPGNYAKGKKTDLGFRHFEDLGISAQGRDANAVWRAVISVSKELKIPVTVAFRWAYKPELKYPGEEGRMAFGK